MIEVVDFDRAEFPCVSIRAWETVQVFLLYREVDLFTETMLIVVYTMAVWYM